MSGTTCSTTRSPWASTHASRRSGPWSGCSPSATDAEVRALTRLELPEHLSEYTARAATLEDAPGVATCVHAAYRHYVARNGLVPVPMLLDYADVIRTSPVTVVVEHGGGVAAVLVLTVGAEGFLLDNVAVQPAHQGKGLGRCLLGYAESEALRQGFDSIYLYTQEVMTENLALYERIGYVEYARRLEDGRPRVYLRKRLGEGAPR